MKLTPAHMRQAFHDIACPPSVEPVPQRGVDLIRELNAREREEVGQRITRTSAQ